MKRISPQDLLHIFNKTETIWEDLRNKSIFITGATGFFGKWLLESFLFVNNRLSLNARVFALSRDPSRFIENFPFYKSEASITFLQGDIMNFNFPDERFDFIIHAATDADAKLNTENPLQMVDTITAGTRNILEFAKIQPLQSFLFTSSGAIYGKQPVTVTHVKETQGFPVDINNANSAYAEGKRIAELYCAIYHSQYQLPVKIARCFAFVGPYLPLDKHYAIGNFILNALKGEDIVLKGDGTPFRSYLYAADLTIWLWTILLKGKNNVPYNVGSNEDLNLTELANIIKDMRELPAVKILTPPTLGKPVERYVPDIDLVKQSLGLTVEIKLKDALEKTFRFYEN